jgi:hypothetical protein
MLLGVVALVRTIWDYTVALTTPVPGFALSNCLYALYLFFSLLPSPSFSFAVVFRFCNIVSRVCLAFFYRISCLINLPHRLPARDLV